MKPARLSVVKVGGSLLDLPDLCSRLERWWQNRPTGTIHWLVVGGGLQVDTIRENWAADRCDDVEAHWSSIKAMRQNSARLAERCVDCFNHIQVQSPSGTVPVLAAHEGSTVFLDVEAVLREMAKRDAAAPLPCDWSVTSDSIAAAIAIAYRAAECVLLKSRLPVSVVNWAGLAREGYVDEHFPELADRLSCVRLTDLRADPCVGWPPELRWEDDVWWD